MTPDFTLGKAECTGCNCSGKLVTWDIPSDKGHKELRGDHEAILRILGRLSHRLTEIERKVDDWMCPDMPDVEDELGEIGFMETDHPLAGTNGRYPKDTYSITDYMRGAANYHRREILFRKF